MLILIFYFYIKILNNDLKTFFNIIYNMPARNKQLKVSNVYGFLSQIDSNSFPDTIIKIKSRAALCLFNAGDKKNMLKAIYLYNEAYDIQYNLRGMYHPRTLHILNLIINCENKIEQIRKNKLLN